MDRINPLIEQELRIRSEFGTLVPSEVVSKALELLLPAARSSTILAIQGSGRYKRPPQWLRDASDIRFERGVPDDGSLLLMLSIPTFGESIPELIIQDDFWRNSVPADFTALTLLEKSINDIAEGRSGSDFVDEHILSKLMEFKRIPGFSNTTIALRDMRNKTSEVLKSAVIDEHLTKRADKLREAIPPPQEGILVGTLDMIKASTRSFAILLESGAELRGIFEGDPEEMKDYFRKRVMVAGTLHYKPSRDPLRIDAYSIRDADEASPIWKRIPEPDVPLTTRLLRKQPQTPKSDVSAFFGSWPGDESDQEIEQILSEIS